MISEQTRRNITDANSELKRCLEHRDVDGAIDAHGKLITALATLSGDLVALGSKSFTLESFTKPLRECLEREDIDGAINAHDRLISTLIALSGELIEFGGNFTVESYVKPIEEDSGRTRRAD